ncbi:hypothetical protein V9T40_003779 [Parthenolecanium corni]|uniref:Uncharacterized protein n=1 Tax=Parthenolecanium corni TaxID=536013 RepID=A0AAN9TRC0_9HEMI
MTQLWSLTASQLFTFVVSLAELQLSQYFSSCLNFQLDVSIFGWMSQFSAGCLTFWLDVSNFGWMSHFSSSWFNFRLVVSNFGWMSQFLTG